MDKFKATCTYQPCELFSQVIFTLRSILVDRVWLTGQSSGAALQKNDILMCNISLLFEILIAFLAVNCKNYTVKSAYKKLIGTKKISSLKPELLTKCTLNQFLAKIEKLTSVAYKYILMIIIIYFICIIILLLTNDNIVRLLWFYSVVNSVC